MSEYSFFTAAFLSKIAQEINTPHHQHPQSQTNRNCTVFKNKKSWKMTK